ncbi:MAG: hypothetical protein C0631_02705 [Sedimenticola sp.]|nr:MAG: hypothetical protein C0631_02705 [Sedimenticola sp.]
MGTKSELKNRYSDNCHYTVQAVRVPYQDKLLFSSFKQMCWRPWPSLGFTPSVEDVNRYHLEQLSLAQKMAIINSYLKERYAIDQKKRALLKKPKRLY